MAPTHNDDTPDEKVKLTVYLDEPTRRELRKRALDVGEPATAIVERLIREYLKKGGR
jgi:hypothetical protein